jgi:hypothetical protein
LILKLEQTLGLVIIEHNSIEKLIFTFLSNRIIYKSLHVWVDVVVVVIGEINGFFFNFTLGCCLCNISATA